MPNSVLMDSLSEETGRLAGILRGFKGVFTLLLVARGATNAYTARFVEVAESPISHS